MENLAREPSGRKSYRPSRITRVIAVRLPLNVYSILERRAGKQKIKPSSYLKKLISNDALRRR